MMLHFNIMFLNALNALNPMVQESCQSDNDKFVKTRFNKDSGNTF